MSLYQDTRELFSSYNNVNDAALPFVDYVFSLLPPSGGIILGDLEITGSLLVDTDFTLDGVVKDNTMAHVISADFNSRALYDSGGNLTFSYDTLVMTDAGGNNSIDGSNRALISNNGLVNIFDWNTGIINDGTGALAIDVFGRALYDLSGNPSLNFDGRNALTSTGAVVVDWENLILYNSLGTPAYDWQTGALALTTAGIIDFGTTSLIRKSGSSNGIQIVANGQATWTFGHNAGELRVVGGFGGQCMEIISTDTVDNFMRLQNNNVTTQYWDSGVFADDYAIRGIIGGAGAPSTIMRILALNGNVGIRNAAPAYDLDVTGTINATAYRVGAAAGASGSWTTVDLKTVTCVNGIITSIV